MRGIGYVELLVTLAIGALLLAGLGGVIGKALQSRDHAHGNNDLYRQARFAMQRMVRAARLSTGLLLPLADNPSTGWQENIRDSQAGGQGRAALALRLPAESDLDEDGTPDADDDGDGRIDEDMPADIQNDGASGLLGFDDDGDGLVDNHSTGDDDEDGSSDEDWIDGIDNDGDGVVDEDPPADGNSDGETGITGVDDDSDGSVDEGAADDNDEDGSAGEDPLNPLVFYLENGVLQERRPVPWDTTSDGAVDGADFVVSPLVENVTHFRVERITTPGARYRRVDLLLTVTRPDTSESLTLQTQVRIGGGL